MCVYIKGQSGFILCLYTLFISHFKTDALMSEVLKVLRYIACVKYCTMNKGSNAMYVKGVKSSSIYTVRAVMLSMSKVSKDLNIHYKDCNAIYVKGVERSSKWSYTSLLITFLIFNRFSIRKSFRKLRLRAFQPMLC